MRKSSHQLSGIFGMASGVVRATSAATVYFFSRITIPN
jgi:hypothetical protein